MGNFTPNWGFKKFLMIALAVAKVTIFDRCYWIDVI
jgi:hypothetical protein